jgi:hypothetical protein
MIEGSESIPLTSGSGSRRPKNTWIRTESGSATLVIAQDMLDHESEKPVLTTSGDIKSEKADHYYITRTYSLLDYLAY